MNKNNLRKLYLSQRDCLDATAISEQSIEISNQLLKLPIWTFTYYHIFLSIEEKNEIDTAPILSILQGKDKEIVIPKMNGKLLTNYLLTDNTVLKKNKWHVPEPVNGLEVPASYLEVVFIPLLAFDSFGNRVGYGKGFYDSLLASCSPNTLKIGLSFFPATETISDIRPEDIGLDYCVTPEKVYCFK